MQKSEYDGILGRGIPMPKIDLNAKRPPFVRKIRIPDEEYKSKRDAYFEQKRKDRKNAKAALKARRKK